MGERDLTRLLACLAPVLRPVHYVVVETDADGRAAAVIVEDEATTKVVELTVADAHCLRYTFVAMWIICTVESDLEAVGVTSNAHCRCHPLPAGHSAGLSPWKKLTGVTGPITLPVTTKPNSLTGQ